MSVIQRILLTLTGAIFATLLQGAVMLFITNYIVPNRSLFGFGQGLVWIVIFLLGMWAIAYSFALTFSNSLSLSLIISFLFSIWMSWISFQSALEIYQRPDYFDREYFMMEVIEICANFIIYPSTALLIWTLQKRFVKI